jgi:hypothetical protein
VSEDKKIVNRGKRVKRMKREDIRDLEEGEDENSEERRDKSKREISQERKSRLYECSGYEEVGIMEWCCTHRDVARISGFVEPPLVPF